MPLSNRSKRNTPLPLPYSYPPIPAHAQDSNAFGRRDFGYRYGVNRNHTSSTWGNPETAVFRSTLERVTEENEELFRTYHPALSEEPYVSVRKEPNNKRSWVIWKTDYTKITPTHIGDREVHIIPRFSTPLLAGSGHYPYPLSGDPIRRDVNPRRALLPEDLDGIRQTLPSASGIRILIAGIAIVFFRNIQDMKDAWRTGIPDSIGGLPVGFLVNEFNASIEPVSSGHAVSSKERPFQSLAALGLKLKMPDKSECITTVTHAFVQLPKRKGAIQMRLSDWAMRVRGGIARFQRPPTTAAQPAQVYGTARKEAPEALGKDVWLAGSNKKIGTIQKTYDLQQNKKLPFPAGFTHDLSLIYGPDLPDICPPPGVNMLGEWARYEDAMEGQPVFAASLNVQYLRWGILDGQVASRAVQAAVFEGCDYVWDKVSRSTSASLLWRTGEDSKYAQGWSGSVLCLGRPSDPEVRPVLFQNYQSPIHKWPVGERPSQETPTDSIKGGFFLPNEVREAEISRGEQNYTHLHVAL